jgi:hypothetical protein
VYTGNTGRYVNIGEILDTHFLSFPEFGWINRNSINFAQILEISPGIVLGIVGVHIILLLFSSGISLSDEIDSERSTPCIETPLNMSASNIICSLGG